MFFTDEYINQIELFENNKWMLDWFCFLKSNNTLANVDLNFSEMKEILKQNFKGL